MVKAIVHELKSHAPFTALGALGGIVFMIIFRNIPSDFSYRVFYAVHPLHVFLSAIATGSMYSFYFRKQTGKRSHFLKLFFITYVGAVGIGTLSDSLLPFFGEKLLNLPGSHPHIGFIEEWWLVNPAAVIGILIAYYLPTTKSPHAMHVLLSTMASLFHIMMAAGDGFSWLLYLPIYLFLFISVWVPCCTSDIIFPLLFIKGEVPHSHHH